MRHCNTKYLLLTLITMSMQLLSGCHEGKSTPNEEDLRHQFENIIDIAYTPNEENYCYGWFTDYGAWMGFTLPEKTNFVNGFCGPFSLDMKRREWIAECAVIPAFNTDNEKVTPLSTIYYPGEGYILSQSKSGTLEQRLCYISAQTALLKITANRAAELIFTSKKWSENTTLEVEQNRLIATNSSGEIVSVTFEPDITITTSDRNYMAKSHTTKKDYYVTISFYTSENELIAGKQKSNKILNSPEEYLAKNNQRWNTYLKKVLRDDMEHQYDRIAVKAIVTLISNWRSHRGGLLHEGIVPSHAVDYFVGFWAWDSWRFSAALASFDSELAKNNIRAMFDYQQPNGMIIDCIYTDPKENNYRNSKPPLISWAVNEIYEYSHDLAFLKEMYPQLLNYYKWWYNERDHNHNGMCEYGSTDGTIVAAAWESGMDNAVRFDEAKILKNRPEKAYSIDQESVDLNAYLALECKLLKKFAKLINKEFDGPDYGHKVADYFFDKKENFFFDKKLDGTFITKMGCEAYTPLWTNIAKPEQVEAMLPILKDEKKFSTYIPFPTLAADNPKYNPKGYWRGPIWIDQTYFAIKGLRNYGYNDLADKYTMQVFDRLEGLKTTAPIHENYGTHTGERLKAPHFSWSSSHLLMLYRDYGK